MRRIHKYIGLPIAAFILWMTASGIVLNHREWFSTIEVSRHWLPDDYQGKLAVDDLGLLLSFIGISCFLIWSYKELIRSRKRNGKRAVCQKSGNG